MKVVDSVTRRAVARGKQDQHEGSIWLQHSTAHMATILIAAPTTEEGTREHDINILLLKIYYATSSSSLSSRFLLPLRNFSFA